MDSKSIGLCPQGFESPRCRFGDVGAMRAVAMCNLQAARDLPIWGHGQRQHARDAPACIGLVIAYTFKINAAMARAQMQCRHISAQNFRIEDCRRFFSCNIFCCKVIRFICARIELCMRIVKSDCPKHVAAGDRGNVLCVNAGRDAST